MLLLLGLAEAAIETPSSPFPFPFPSPAILLCLLLPSSPLPPLSPASALPDVVAKSRYLCVNDGDDDDDDASESGNGSEMRKEMKGTRSRSRRMFVTTMTVLGALFFVLVFSLFFLCDRRRGNRRG